LDPQLVLRPARPQRSIVGGFRSRRNEVGIRRLSRRGPIRVHTCRLPPPAVMAERTFFRLCPIPTEQGHFGRSNRGSCDRVFLVAWPRGVRTKRYAHPNRWRVSLSAIWITLRAAPFSSWSPTTKIDHARPGGPDRSARRRPTSTSGRVSASIG